ncbi:hypothetical protein [Mesorhizobium sp. M1365]|uniref:hypothetical protein n=1 Tax=Mesorhizobium sp. M1365 TaxID=2957090 RepID=UPI00333D42CF
MISKEAAIGSLTVRQQDLTVDWRPPRKYDLLIAALSWETRATAALATLSGDLPRLSLIKFKSWNDAIEDRKLAMLAEIRKFATIAETVSLAPSTDSQENFSTLEAWIREKYVAVKRPLRILIDITCIPKSYLLFLIGLGFTRDYFACFDCIYAGGKYDLNQEASSLEGSKPAIGGPRSLISLGDWRSTLIPYLTAGQYLPGTIDLIVAMGGELGLSLPFIERVEPGRLKLIFIEETAPNDNLPMLASERSALNDLMSAPNVTRTDHGLCDVIGVAQEAVAFCRSGPSVGTTGMALGSKPHAIALAVAALAETKMGVLTRVPVSYKTVDVEPSGRMLFVQVEDRFDPCSYIDVP